MIRRRLVGAIPVLIGMSFLVFFLMQLAPGDPVTLLLGEDAEPHEIEEVTREWGLDQPIIVQYWQFLSQAVQGNFGESMRYGEPVTQLVAERLPATVELAMASLLVAIIHRASHWRVFRHQAQFPVGSLGHGPWRWSASPCPTSGSASCSSSSSAASSTFCRWRAG